MRTYASYEASRFVLRTDSPQLRRHADLHRQGDASSRNVPEGRGVHRRFPNIEGIKKLDDYTVRSPPTF
jgi:hypothetical protein